MIDHVSGAFTQGTTITISGSGFSTKRNGQILFDNFSDGVVGEDIAARGTWTWFGGSGGKSAVPPYVISTANPYLGSKSARAVVGVNQNPGGGDDFGDYLRFSTAQTELYLESAISLHFAVFGPSTSGPQVKLFRAITDGDPTVAPDPILTFTRANSDASAQTNSLIALASSGYASDSFYVDLSGGDPFPPDTWTQFCMYEKLSTPGKSDGMRFMNVNGKNGITYSWYPGTFSDPDKTGVSNGAWNGVPMMTRSKSISDGFWRLYLPFFTRSEMSLTMDLGYVYLNDSPERVVVHNAPTLAASTRYQVQKQLSRSASTIVIEYQQGNLLAGDTKYVTVVNADNAFSPSH